MYTFYVLCVCELWKDSVLFMKSNRDWTYPNVHDDMESLPVMWWLEIQYDHRSRVRKTCFKQFL